MRFTLITIGSTGDVRPYLCLGEELRRRGHEVTLCAFADFEKAVTERGFRFAPLSGNAHALINNLMKPGASWIGFLRGVRRTLCVILQPFLQDMMAACEGADVIVSTYFGGMAQSIAEKNGVPFIQTHYYPMDANAVTPIARAPGLRAGPAWNKMSYKMGYLLINLLEKYYLSDWRRAQGMSPRRLGSGPCYELNGHIIPVLYAMSPLLMPRPPEWDANIHMTGFWLDDSVIDFTPEPALEEFLREEPKPVYIGFGSMLSGDMTQTLSIVLQAVKRSGVRAVICPGWGHAVIPPQENVYVAGFLPHDWLFSRVAAVVHHGGAGTTAAGVLAGRPTLVIPFGGDQPFWALRVRMLGLGPRPIRREKLTVAKLTRALRDLVTVKSYAVAAQELGERLRLENGVGIAANIIEDEVRKWREADGQSPQC